MSSFFFYVFFGCLADKFGQKIFAKYVYMSDLIIKMLGDHITLFSVSQMKNMYESRIAKLAMYSTRNSSFKIKTAAVNNFFPTCSGEL